MKKIFQKSKRGFTLIELSVAMAVTGIAMAMLSVCFVAVQNFNTTKQKQIELQTEISTLQTEIGKFTNLYSSSVYDFTVSNSTLNIKENETTISTIVFENFTLKIAGSEICSFKHISNITFAYDLPILACNFTYNEQSSVLLFTHYSAEA